MNLAGLKSWRRISTGTPTTPSCNIRRLPSSTSTRPRFFQRAERELRLPNRSDNWKTYLRFHVADSSSPYLSSNFVQENFDFYRKYLRGAKEMQPRWKRCVQYTDRDLGEALGQAYVRKVFSPELKQSTLEMVQRIEAAMEQRIRGARLDEPGNQAAGAGQTARHSQQDRLSRQMARLQLRNDHRATTSSATSQRRTPSRRRRDIAKIGKPVDHGEWDISPPTVDAYYNPQMNDINFPAGVLQPPLYDAKMDDAPNYGDTGGTIGHELTHGFDDEGSQFDATGNLKNWWTKTDREKFDERTKCVSDQYSVLRRRGRRSHQRQAHDGRRCCRSGRRDSGLHCVESRHQRQKSAADRRPDSRAALLHRLTRSGTAPTSVPKICACARRSIRTRPLNTASMASS